MIVSLNKINTKNSRGNKMSTRPSTDVKMMVEGIFERNSRAR